MAEFVIFRLLMIATAIAGAMIIIPAMDYAYGVFHR